MQFAASALLRKISGATAAALVGAAVLLAPDPAQAQNRGGWHGDGWHGGGWHGGGWGWGWGFGAGILAADAALMGWPYYGYPYGPYPYAYYPPAVSSVTVLQPAPVMQSAPAAPVAPVAPAYYYCNSPKGYYPYVATCQTQWQQVPVSPPGAP